MKKVIKFMYDHKEGFFSVVEKDNYYYTLVQKDTPKVEHVQKTNKLSIAYEIKNPTYKDVLVRIINDQNTIKWVYDKLEEQNNLYFKTLDESLCVLEIDKE
jgi:general stress protein 26